MCNTPIDSKAKFQCQNMTQRAEKRAAVLARKLQENIIRRVQQSKAIDLENQTKSTARALRKKNQSNHDAKPSS